MKKPLGENPLYSFARHYIGLQLLKLAGFLNLQVEGLEGAVEWIAEIAVVALAWVLVKFIVPKLTEWGFTKFRESNSTSKLPLIFFVFGMGVLSLGSVGCGSRDWPEVNGYIYHEESGAKAGLGGGRWFLRAPVKTTEGVDGYVEITGDK